MSETCATLALARGESLLDFEVKTGFETRVYEGMRVQVGAGLVVDFSSSEEWESRLCHLRPRLPDGTSLTALYRVLLDSRKESPFRGVIEGTDPRLAGLLESLRRAVLEKDEAGLGAALEHVVGLGPGLTPSGDDLITGLSLTRSVFREVRLRQGKGDALWGVVVRRALTRTHELSAFFVEEALSGRGHEFAEDTLAFLLEGRPRETALAASRLIGLGATSGFDIGVGLYLAAEWERRYAWCSGGW
jgi:hypothetical protein